MSQILVTACVLYLLIELALVPATKARDKPVSWLRVMLIMLGWGYLGYWAVTTYPSWMR